MGWKTLVWKTMDLKIAQDGQADKEAERQYRKTIGQEDRNPGRKRDRKRVTRS